MERKKITLQTSLRDTIFILSEGNPGAMRILSEIISLQRRNFLLLLSLDDMNIRGAEIWLGYKDYCGCDLDKFMDCIRNRDVGMIRRINEETIKGKCGRKAVVGGASC